MTAFHSVSEIKAPGQGSSRKPHGQLREFLVKLPGVTIGTRFGGEAFFFWKRFFCHFHPTRSLVFLETFVWNKVEDVISEVPGVIPHPEYGGYGWVRLPLISEDAVSRGRQLIETTYRYLRTIRRVSVPSEEFQPGTLDLLRTKLREINVRIKEAKKDKSDPSRSSQLLRLRTSRPFTRRGNKNAQRPSRPPLTGSPGIFKPGVEYNVAG